MVNQDLNWISNYIWGIADDVLRDLYVRGKYRDVILPMTVLRRLDAVLEESKQAVLDMKSDPRRSRPGGAGLSPSAGSGAGVLQHLEVHPARPESPAPTASSWKPTSGPGSTGSRRTCRTSSTTSSFRNQIPRLSKADALGTLIEKLTSPDINLSPASVSHADGSVKHPGLDNHGMGTIFEELVRRFNEENNEEAGEHWTPRDAVRLMAKLVFLPIADRISSGHLPAVRRRLRHRRHPDGG